MLAPTAFASAIDPLAPSMIPAAAETLASGAFAFPGITNLPTFLGIP